MNRVKFRIDFRSLQKDQDRHDRYFHKDIYGKSNTEALQHFAWHFGKYSWAARKADATDDAALRQKNLTDTFIVCLASANRLGVSFANDLTSLILTHPDAEQSYADAFQEQTAVMCKAAEAADHDEDFPVRSVMEDAIVAIARYTWDEAENHDIDLQKSVRTRWAEIEAKVLAPV